MTHVNFQSFWKPFTAPPELGQNGSDPFISEKKWFGLWGSWYSNRPARTHDFNAKIGFEKNAPSPEISPKMCQFLLVWFGTAILGTFLVISRDSVHIFQTRFLCWNGESEPADMNIMNDFQTYKGVRAILSAISSSENDPNLTF